MEFSLHQIDTKGSLFCQSAYPYSFSEFESIQGLNSVQMTISFGFIGEIMNGSQPEIAPQKRKFGTIIYFDSLFNRNLKFSLKPNLIFFTLFLVRGRSQTTFANFANF